ncbi:hypothetical protein ACIRU8_38550 [Streptomyces sp. NPDC101175]|uniref:hypothetical protein n=1 Tax=Streptomyces sp. NPDC101175 TaxID=3366123 RepID=UPI003832A79E
MGLTLFAADGDTSSPDVGWSYSGFAAFRRQLARAEGIDLNEMWGFGGERPWSDVSTALEPSSIARTTVEASSRPPNAPRSCPVSKRLCVTKDVELLFH